MNSINPKDIKPTTATTFEEVKVGDELIVWHGGGFYSGRYGKRVVTRVTAKQFACGFGEVKDGKHQFERVYRRSDGRQIGGYDRHESIYLATQEKLAQVAEHFGEQERSSRFRRALEDMNTAIAKRGGERIILEADKLAAFEAAAEAVKAAIA